MRNLAISGHSWPVLGLLRSRYQRPKPAISIFDPVLTELSEIGEKVLNSNDEMRNLAILDHFWPIFGLLWPR